MSELEDFNYECLHSHNGLRKEHNAPPLRYSKQLSLDAQRYAELIAAKDEMEHSKKEDRNDAGENLAMSMRPFVDYKYSGLGASASWYSEIKDYDFNKEAQPPNNPATGHFTQLIWKGSKEAGFGRAKNPTSNCWYIVGRYQPAGNFIGKYLENVPPLPRGQKWDKVPIIEEYLDELRTMEYTPARKHILDDWRANWMSGTKAGVSYCDVVETFTTPTGSTYTGENHFSEDPRKLPRPIFQSQLDDSVYDLGDDQLNGYASDKDSDKGENEEIKSFIEAVVSQHNYYRRNHNVATLNLDNQLNTYAQDWADELALENKMSFSNYLFENVPLGENITTKKGNVTEESAKALVDSWYNEGRNYNYRKEPDNFKSVGHFTQLLWKKSKKIGVGVGKNSKGESFIVCFYSPAGNTKNEFSQNVLKS